jgi:hypothetical protein
MCFFLNDLHYFLMKTLNILQGYQVVVDLPHDFVDVGKGEVGLVLRVLVPASV